MTTTALPTITLPELLAQAGLQTRVDRKYLVPLSTLAAIPTADPGLRVLEIDGLTRHAYASRYEDTAGRESYLLAARGRPSRYKVRTRTYCDSGLEFLEVKTRTRRGETVKDRLALDIATRLEVRRFVPATIRERTGLELGSRDPLRPVLDIHYDRTTYYLPATGLARPWTRTSSGPTSRAGHAWGSVGWRSSRRSRRGRPRRWTGCCGGWGTGRCGCRSSPAARPCSPTCPRTGGTARSPAWPRTCVPCLADLPTSYFRPADFVHHPRRVRTRGGPSSCRRPAELVPPARIRPRLATLNPMATRVVTEMLSDLSGQPADRTVAFGVGKARYEIDLTSDEAHGLLEALQPYVEVARRVGPGSAPAK